MPLPDQGPHATPQPDEAGGRILPARQLLARKWGYLLSGVIVIPLSRDELDRELLSLLDALCAVISGERADTAPAEQVGERLAALGYVGEAGLKRTTDVLGKGLLTLPEFQPVTRYAERIVLGLGALACGFLAASTRAVLEQQETMHLSLLKAVRDANWNLKESEARFDEVVTASASGVMLLGLDGRIVRANAAIGDMLCRPAAELTDTTLFDHVHPDSAEILRDAMQALCDGRKDRIRQSHRLLRPDGDVARVSLTASLLRGPDDQPGHFVAVAEDGTELMLLQSELSRQALHDLLTGLPNRQYFGTHLESALRRADPVHGVTLFHLDLDAFGMVCNSLGRGAGERLLVHFAHRLKSVFAREKAMIARFDGDEFGILLENSATTPDVAKLVASINDERADPFYVDGHGLALSASVGVVRLPSPDIDPAELLRQADRSLRRAKSHRRGQWTLFQPDVDAGDRRADALAVGMPGAWENGEISVRYRPIARLAGGGIAGVEAMLSWDRPGSRALAHDRCVKLAEETGLILPLGEWLLRVSSRQAQWWRQRLGFDLPLAVGLTPHQVSDAGLAARVTRVLEETGLPPGRLMAGLPVGVLPDAEAAGNLSALAGLGVQTMLDDFGLGPDDLRVAEELPVRSVRVARRIVEWQARSGSALPGVLVPSVRQLGATVVVDGIASEAQAEWWREAGADLATGEFFGTASSPGDAIAHLTGGDFQ